VSASVSRGVTRRAGVWVRALVAVVTIAVLAAGVPWLLMVTVGNPIPTDGWTWTQPLTDQALLGFVAGLAWLFWAQFIACVLVEAIATLRIASGRSAQWMTRLPGTFTGQQHLARVLVEAVVTVGLGAGIATSPAATIQAHAAVVTEPVQPRLDPQPTAASIPAATDRSAAEVASRHRKHRVRTVVVAKGDTLWSIAERHLGSGEQWRTIADLNQGRAMADGQRFVQASSIMPGWELLVPDHMAYGERTDTATIMVAAGDTLSGIAETVYGEADAWLRLYQANRDQVTDPDLIYPGQVLHTPRARAPRAKAVDPRRVDQRRPESAGPTEPKPPDAVTFTAPGHDPAEPTAEPTAVPSSHPTPEVTSRTPADHQPDDGHLAQSLVGGGSLLAGSALVLFLGHRHRQFRARRSGRAIAPTPPELVPTERVIRSTGSAGGVAARFLDQALRELSLRLAQAGQALPDVEAVRLADDQVELLLVTPPGSQPPPPWKIGQDGGRWIRGRDPQPQPVDALAPYPTLVAIGTAEDGATWLLDLEATSVLNLRGDRVACENLARFLAAELAINTWSDHVDVTVAAFGPDLVTLNPSRLTHADHADVDTLIKAARRIQEGEETIGTDLLTGRRDANGADTWMPRILIADDAAQPGLDEASQRLLDELAGHTGRSAVALVDYGGASVNSGGVTLTIDAHNTLTGRDWGVRLTANQLTADAASRLAALFHAAATEEDAPMPADADTGPVGSVADAAGALRQEHTQPRDPAGNNDALLPLPNQQYIGSAATTPADLAALAPQVPEATRSEVLALDPGLDEDLADWDQSDTPRPRLRVLGPVDVRTSGDHPDIARRRAYCTELVAYLAVHEHGATPAQAADAFGIQANSLHSRIGITRRWLGTDPVTRDWYLPDSTISPSAKTRGVPVYQITRLLSDADLFRRLRARGQARGPDGIDDLIAALRLVDGEPYTQLRTGGYGWLADNPHDQYLTAGIVDVSHIVATHALAAGDGSLAVWASERAITAAPSEDKPRLDLAQALKLLGKPDDAAEYVSREILNRSDDREAPPDPLARTNDLLNESRVRRQYGRERSDDQGSR
jgi:nucleoid-associated protein YgaU